MKKILFCCSRHIVIVFMFVAGTIPNCFALNNYVMRFEFPFGIGDYPTTVTHGTRVRSLISIESFVHEKRHIEAIVTWPAELKLCNLTEYRIGNSNSLRLPFELRTQNDIWYHLVEFEIAESAAAGKYEVVCAVDSIVDETLHKPFYIVDKDYAGTHIRLKSFTVPCDGEGRGVSKQQANTFVVKDQASRLLRSFFVSESGHEGENAAFELENSGDLPVLLDIQYSIHDPVNDSMVEWLENLRQESGLAGKGISVRVFIEPHSSTSSILKIHSRENRLVPGTYRQWLRVAMCSSETPVLEVSRPLYIRELNITNTAATGFALIVAVAGIVAMFALRRMLWGKLTSREYILIALYAAIAFAVVSIPSTILTNVLHAIFGPFSFLFTGIFSEVIAYLLLISLVVLLPRPGVTTSFLIVKFLLSAVVLGNFSVFSILWYPMRAVILELAFYFSGIYDKMFQEKQTWNKAAVVWIALVIGLADMLLAFISLNMSMFFYRLFYADWYLWLYCIVSGFLYTFIAVPLGLRLGAGLRKVAID